MHLITKKIIIEAQQNYPELEHALNSWYKVMSTNNFSNFATLKKVFNSVDKVDDSFVFNIGGNKLRLIANIHFNRQKVYIRSI